MVHRICVVWHALSNLEKVDFATSEAAPSCAGQGEKVKSRQASRQPCRRRVNEKVKSSTPKQGEKLKSQPICSPCDAATRLHLFTFSPRVAATRLRFFTTGVAATRLRFLFFSYPQNRASESMSRMLAECVESARGIMRHRPVVATTCRATCSLAQDSSQKQRCLRSTNIQQGTPQGAFCVAS